MQAKRKEAEYRENQIGVDFTPCPADDCIRVYVTGQILTASNFPNTEIFISYRFSLPPGWKEDIPQQIRAMDLSPEQLKEYNCMQSMTQTVSPVLAKNEDGGVTNEFYICFPIDIQLLAKQRAAQQEWPALHFEVFEKDSWDRLYNQGCGFLTIPSHPGTYTIETKTWKPNLQNKIRVFEFFLGGLTRPKQIEFISKSEDLTELDHKGPINRSLFNTISSGSIKTRLNVSIQSKKIKNDERSNYKMIKFSEETEIVKSQLAKSQVPGQVNTGNLLGGRFTTTKLNK